MNKRGLAIITGSGAKRVGFYVAEILAQRGYDIALHYHSSREQAEKNATYLRTFGVEVQLFQANLANEDEVERLCQAVRFKWPEVQVLVNTAAIWNRKSLEETKSEDVIAHFQTNTLGTFLMCQKVGLQMTSQSTGGVIINIGDWAEVRPYLDYAAYFPSKGGVTTLTRTFAVELAARNPHVRVNCILPGPVMLPPDLSEEERDAAIAGTLVKREGTPQHIAHAVLALIENDFITGVCLPVDGGRTLCS